MQTFIIVCEDKGSSWRQVFEVTNRNFVNLKESQQPPSSDQLWYRKDESDGSFSIVSMSNGRALKCSEPEASQVVLCDISERDLWMMKGSYIVCKRTSQLMHLGDHKTLYCGDEKKLHKKRKSFKFKKVVCRGSYNCCHG